MLTSGLCRLEGWALTFPLSGHRVARLPGRHNPGSSQVLEEGQQRVGGPVAAGRDAGWRGAGEGALLDGEVGVQVNLGGAELLVAEPERDHGQVCSCFA